MWRIAWNIRDWIETCGGGRGADGACLTEADYDLAPLIRALVPQRTPCFAGESLLMDACESRAPGNNVREEVGDTVLDGHRNFHPRAMPPSLVSGSPLRKDEHGSPRQHTGGSSASLWSRA